MRHKSFGRHALKVWRRWIARAIGEPKGKACGLERRDVWCAKPQRKGAKVARICWETTKGGKEEHTCSRYKVNGEPKFAIEIGTKNFAQLNLFIHVWDVHVCVFVRERFPLWVCSCLGIYVKCCFLFVQLGANKGNQLCIWKYSNVIIRNDTKWILCVEEHNHVSGYLTL